MKTAIVWTNQEECKLCLGEGDLSRFHNVWVGTWTDNDKLKELQQDLATTSYDERGNFLFKEVTRDEFTDEIRHGAEVIICGFLL